MKTKQIRKFYVPTDAEDAIINNGIAVDPDTFEPSDEQFALFQSAKSDNIADLAKERITIKLSPDVILAFRAMGSGWQTRIDAILKEWLAHNNL